MSVLPFRNVFVLFQSLQAQVANVVVTGSCAPTSAAVDSCRSVIDLTDDDDANTAVAKPPAPAPIQQVILVAPPHPASLPPPLTLPSTAIVKPTMRPVPPPPLHIAPNQQARLQVKKSSSTSTTYSVNHSIY